MSRFRNFVLFVAMSALTAPPATRADEPPAVDKASAEAVLTKAGLTRVSSSYVVQEEIEAYDLVEVIEKLRAALPNRMREYQALKQRYNFKKAESNRLRIKAHQVHYVYNSEKKRYEENKNEYDRLISQMQSIDDEAEQIRQEARPIERKIAEDAREIEGHMARHRVLVSRALNQYAALAARSEIKAALRELNRGTRSKLALGPIAAYRQYLLEQSVDTLAALGYRREGDLYWLSEDAEFIKRGEQARLLWHEVVMYERRLAPPGQAAPTVAIGSAPPGPATTRPVATPPVPSRPPVAVVPGAGAARPTTAPGVKSLTAAQIAAKRAELVRRVRELRQQADALQVRRDVIRAESEASDALEVINRASPKARRPRLGNKPGWMQALQDLEDMERAIRTEEIPLTRDGGRLKVDARLNGKPASLVVDPEAEWVKLPDHLAAELGVQPAPDARTVPLDLGGGRTVQARTARIPTLQVGSIADEGVVCLVLPPGSGDGPPVLGGTFLNRVVAEIDGESGTLTLTRVSPPPTATPDRPASKPKGKAS